MSTKTTRWPALLIAAVLLAALLLKLPNLGHPTLTKLDESYHAIVARNLLKHPLTPTLLDPAYLPAQPGDWHQAHVWLHKPILPLWQIALSYALLGVNAFALRLPSLLLSTASIFLTYDIGRRLANRRSALIAAALQAIIPALAMQVHGYAFSDHIDVALLFWIQLAAWFTVRAMESSRTIDIALAGAAQGLAFLSKTYPALVVTLIAIVAWRYTAQWRGRRFWTALGIFLAATVLIAAPWNIYTAIRWPTEFFAEHGLILRHLGSNVENWAAPWDRVLADYLLRIFHVLYPTALAALLLLAGSIRRDRSLAVLYAWAMGVILPFTLATSKTPAATIPAVPPMLLLLGILLDRAWQGRPAALAAAAVGLLLAAFTPGLIMAKGWGYPEPPVFAGVLRENIWIIWHLLAALAAAAILTLIWRRLSSLQQRLRQIGIVLIALGLVLIAVHLARLSWKVTRQQPRYPSYAEMGAYVQQHLPAHAVLLVEQPTKLEHLLAMFYADRSSYPLPQPPWGDLIHQIRQAGGQPYIISNHQLPLPALYHSQSDNRWLFAVP